MMKRNSAFETRISYIANIQEFIDDLNNESVSMKTIENKYTNVFDVLRNSVLNYKASVKDRMIDLTAFNDLNEFGLNEAVSNHYLCAVLNSYPDLKWCDISLVNRELLLTDLRTYDLYKLGRFDNCEAFEIEVTNALPEHVVDKLLGNLDVR